MSTPLLTRDPVEEGFLDQLRANPNDDDTRLVYSDWLEQHVSREGHRDKLELLRLQLSLKNLPAKDPEFQKSSERLRELALKVDQKWRMLVGRAPIEGCEIKFDFVCPKQWTKLKPTTLGEDVRFCDACERNVHYSRTVEEASEHARKGMCVVVDLVQLRRPYDLNGQPVFPTIDIDNIPMPAGAAIPNPPPLRPATPSLIDKVRSFFRRSKGHADDQF